MPVQSLYSVLSRAIGVQLLKALPFLCSKTVHDSLCLSACRCVPSHPHENEELVYCLMSFPKQVLEKLICNTLRAWNFLVW